MHLICLFLLSFCFCKFSLFHEFNQLFYFILIYFNLFYFILFTRCKNFDVLRFILNHTIYLFYIFLFRLVYWSQIHVKHQVVWHCSYFLLKLIIVPDYLFYSIVLSYRIVGLIKDGELKFFSPVTSISVRSTIGNNNGNNSKTVKNNLSSRSTESERNKENGGKERRGSVGGKEKSTKEREDENDIDDMGVPSVPSYDTTGMYNNVNSARRKSMENLRLKNLNMTPGEFSSAVWSEIFLVGREDGTVDLFQVHFYLLLFFPLLLLLLFLFPLLCMLMYVNIYMYVCICVRKQV